MNGVNKVIIIGRAGTDGEYRAMPDGKGLCNLSLATSESWKDKNSGEQKEKTEWHRAVCFGRLAEICGQYVKKGDPIYIEGKLATRKWEKDGVTHYSTEIVFNQMQMLGSKNKQDNHAPPSQRQPAQQYDKFDDDVPF